MDVDQLGRHTHRHTHTHVQPSLHKCNLSSLNSSGSAGVSSCSFAPWSTRTNHYENNTRSVYLAFSVSFPVCMSCICAVCISVHMCVCLCVGVYLICMNAVEGLCVNDFLEECVGKRGRMSACHMCKCYMQPPSPEPGPTFMIIMCMYFSEISTVGSE